MDQIHTRAGAAETKAANVAPAPADPAEPGEELAGATYENVQVLKNVSVNEFNRLMVSMTEWVSPEQAAPTATTPRTWPTTASTRRRSPAGCCR